MSPSGIIVLSWNGHATPAESQSEFPENAQSEAHRTTCVEEATCELASKVLHDAHKKWQKPNLIDEMVCALIRGDEKVELIAINPKDPRNITYHQVWLFSDTSEIPKRALFRCIWRVQIGNFGKCITVPFLGPFTYE
jgi:hypothetical protein